MTKRIILFAVILVISLSAMAQGINGRVISSQGEAVRDANVVLQRSDSSFVDVAVTDEAGRFVFGVNLDVFRLVVHHLAYHSVELKSCKANVGDIVLEPSDVVLGDLVISSYVSYEAVYFPTCEVTYKYGYVGVGKLSVKVKVTLNKLTYNIDLGDRNIVHLAGCDDITIYGCINAKDVSTGSVDGVYLMTLDSG